VSKRVFTDQLGRSIAINFPPKRIISLVPSQTELLFYIGLSDSLVGITKFCIHPAEEVKIVTKVGGTKTVRFDVIDQLQPDLIIGNKEENEQSVVAGLAEKYPVWLSDITHFDDSLRMIQNVGEITDRGQQAAELIQQIEIAFKNIKLRTEKRVLYLIWKSPWMAAGKNTFIDSMFAKGGWVNATSLERYPSLTESQIESINPDIVFLSSEPFPFSDKHIGELKTLLPEAKIILVDGEMFSWYGSRLLLAPAYLNSLAL